MNSPRVSVIIPAYNAEKYIAEAIDSVIKQSCPDVECIVVDDGSTDKTAAIVKGYGERVRYIYQENAERSIARNNGLAIATGDFVSFLDADDYLSPEKITQQLVFLETHPEYDAVYSKVLYFRENGERYYYSVNRATPCGDILAELIYSSFITIHSPLFRKSAVVNVVGFNPAFKRYEDWEFFLRLAVSGVMFGFIDEFHAFVRMHLGNTVHDRVKMFEAKSAVVGHFIFEYAASLSARGIDAALVSAFHRADYGRTLILNGRVDEGRRLIAEVCGLSIPHKRKFQLFSKMAEVFGHRPLVWIQTIVDHCFKYRREAVSAMKDRV